ncbi:hypothetical protein CYMTET_9765 [Cymbomonas tetramitiformis]|uniref:Ubiquitin-like domain-containing protein n=1 Tax=Cymbomonas tetramitiformis TaxID=36881 RepID=A0AAE0GQF3_9CHLO|nr:hypothetical protein CYMTET_37414 [Cymbomonas tetramitiformis]KAK3282490.1 hypothetical protein CYMTET_9765 [Cymbomonas tetramitiformis]
MATALNVPGQSFFEELIGKFLNHKSIRDLEERLLQAPFLSLRCPHYHARGVFSAKPMVQELVEHYCEFMFVLRGRFSDRATRVEAYPPLPPPLIDRVWCEHILDTQGYDAFCSAIFGKFLHRDASVDLHRNTHRREICRAKTTLEYAKRLGTQRINRLIIAGLWWPTRSFEEPADADDIAEVEEVLTEVSRKRHAEEHGQGTVEASEDKRSRTETEDQPMDIFIQERAEFAGEGPIPKRFQFRIGDTVHHVTSSLCARRVPPGVGANRLTLSFGGIPLDPKKTLRSYGVFENSVLQVHAQ